MSKEDLIIVGTGIEGALWRLEDSRTRTLESIRDLPEEALDWYVDGFPNSIGTLLYHIALIEADWLFVEALGEGYEQVDHLFPHGVRDSTGRLTVIENMSLAEHIARLNTVRQILLNAYRTMDAAYYTQKRDLPDYFVTPEWVIHHLNQHEDEHRGEIMMLKSIYTATMTSE